VTEPWNKRKKIFYHEEREEHEALKQKSKDLSSLNDLHVLHGIYFHAFLKIYMFSFMLHEHAFKVMSVK